MLQIAIHFTCLLFLIRKGRPQAMLNKPVLARGYSDLTKCWCFHALGVNSFALFKCRFSVATQYAKDPTSTLYLLAMYTEDRFLHDRISFILKASQPFKFKNNHPYCYERPESWLTKARAVRFI